MVGFKTYVISIFIVSVYGMLSAQFTPEQEVIYSSYIKGNAVASKEGQVEDVDKYTTPNMFSNNDSDVLPPSSDNSIGDADRIESIHSPGLRAFGYDLFEGSPESFASIMEATPPPDYKLGPGDHVLVNVWGRVDMQLELTIDREGKIFIPKVGEIIAWGLTMDDFKRRLNDALSSSYSDYELSVSLGKIRRIKVFVYGEVKKPGGYTLSSLATLFSALHSAGGASGNGSLRTIKHIRHNKLLDRIDLYRFLLTGDNSQDTELQSGDVIFVPIVGSKVGITGEVKRPAIYELIGGEKLRDLVELAGGPTAEAFLQKVDIERVGSDDSRILLTVDLSGGNEDLNNMELTDADLINIPSMFDSVKNTVVINGHVKHPGRYELEEHMSVSDLIGCGEFLIADSYLERANLFRTIPDMTREVFAIDLEGILHGNDSTDYLLMDKDSLVVYSHKDIKRNMRVSIAGAIKKPGIYEYFNDMKLSDLIFLAGNPLKKAYLLRAEIARLNPGKPADVIFVNLKEVQDKQSEDGDLFLEEDDIVYIRSIPGWRLGESITIDGEVEFPGSYALIRENERLLDILERCGGPTNEAFLEGLVFLRSSLSAEIERRQIRGILESTEPTMLDSLNRPIPKINNNADFGQVNRIVIDIERLRKKADSQDNLVLRNGDYIYIPQKPSGIQVLGAVASSGTITYKDDKRPKYFVQKAGGFTANASKSQVRLVKADGRIYAGGKALGQDVDLGDIVVVPYRIKKEKDWLRTAASAAGVVTSIATTVFIIDRLK
ncbi:MAG: SLBB domain-containing protein [candidate division Zixibacteria bacterium]